MLDFHGAVVLVSGGISGIGLACADVFAKHGARVIAAAIDAPTESAESADGVARIDAMRLDVRSEEGWAHCIQLVRSIKSDRWASFLSAWGLDLTRYEGNRRKRVWLCRRPSASLGLRAATIT